MDNAINKQRNLRGQSRLQHRALTALFVCMAVLLGYLAAQYRVQWDVSHNGRNSLSEASIEIVQKMQGPVEVIAYATEQHAEFGDIRAIITDFVSLYQRIKPDLTLTFIDPIAQPQLAQAANVQVNGEMVIGFNQKTEHLTSINEQAFTNALLRLARSESRLIVELSGHGERRLNGVGNYDLGEFGQQLRAFGLASESFSFADGSVIPAHADMLLIASPQTDLLPGEVDKLLDYVDGGGNLLWLVDQEALRGLLPLAERLRLTLTPGIVIDPQAEALRMPRTFALAATYAQHPVTNHFNPMTVFPFARQILINENEEWQSVSLVDAASNGWIETGDTETETGFDQADDIAGPVSIAVALTRTVQDREQRIAVIGSSYFLANMYLGNGGNLDFGVNLVNWLAGDDELIAIQPRATLDHSLMFGEMQLALIAVIALVMLPALFIGCGTVIWWRRRRNG